MSLTECTRDRFLGGRIVADQPRDGFRAGHDTVLLAAAVTAAFGESVLELGSGAGIASLCLAARVAGIRVLGIEADAGLVRLANENAARNGMAERVRFVAGNVLSFGRGETFDQVFFNPPFHPDTGQVSPHAARDSARRDSEGAVARWTRAALELTKPHGTVTAILRADRAGEMLAEADGNAAMMFPLFPHAGEAPKRAIIRIEIGSCGTHCTVAGLVLHEADGRNTVAVEAVLRHGGALSLA